MEQFSVVGKRLPRVDARDKVTGVARFVVDVKLPGMLCGKILWSPHPHARILAIDTSRAQGLHGVKAVLTSADLPHHLRRGTEEPPLVGDKVRHVGDAIAAVAAIDEEIAEEALDLIKVEYELLPAVFDPEEAMRPNAPLVHEVEDNIATRLEIKRGDVEEGFRQADLILEDRFTFSSVTHCCLEPHACIASFDASGRLTLWSSLAHLYRARMLLARALGLSENEVRLIQPAIGGDFGSKGPPHRLDYICPFLAKKAGRSVKIVHTREEEFIATRPRMPAIVQLKMGVKWDGKIVAKETKIIADQGAYLTGGQMIMGTTAIRHESLYRFSNIKTEATLVYTNKMPIGPFRGLGNPQGTFPLESMLDMLADKLGMDAAELRLRNATRTGDVTVHGWEIKSCGLSECIEKSAKGAGWRSRRASKEGKRGLGMGCAIHVSGRKNVDGFLGSSAFVRVNEDGTVNLITGEGEVGQGASTVLSQICAEELGVRLEDILISVADTEVAPHAANPGASKVTHIGGNAVKAAAADAKKQLFEIAADKLEASPEDLEAKEGKIYVRGSPEKALSISETVKAGLYRQGSRLVLGKGYYASTASGTDLKNYYGNQSTAYSFAAQVADVEVDTETGQVKVLKFVAAHDLGRAINPMSAEGQIEGAIAQGVGSALTEDIIRAGGKPANPNFVDYKIPTAMDMPKTEPILVESNDPNGPFGAKGLGEPALVPTVPAIANAIYHAVGIRLRELPFTPEKVLQALREKGRSG